VKMILGFLEWTNLSNITRVCSMWHSFLKDPLFLQKFVIGTLAPTDVNGVIYWFATEGGSVAWSNPAIKLNLQYSDLENLHHSLDLPDLVRTFDDVENNDKYFSSNGNPWFSVDIPSPHALIPSHYKLKNGGGRGCVIKTWNFEGRTRKSDWVVIKEHINEEIFEQDQTNGFGSHVFQVTCKTPYTSFRIVQLNGRHFFVHRIELYGRLVW